MFSKLFKRVATWYTQASMHPPSIIAFIKICHGQLRFCLLVRIGPKAGIKRMIIIGVKKWFLYHLVLCIVENFNIWPLSLIIAINIIILVRTVIKQMFLFIFIFFFYNTESKLSARVFLKWTSFTKVISIRLHSKIILNHNNIEKLHLIATG